jgi:hypothetical protein
MRRSSQQRRWPCLPQHFLATLPILQQVGTGSLAASLLP